MTYRGFDTSSYPGDEVMAALRPYFDWCGFYLRGPSHPDQSWTAKLSFLKGLGYGTAPIFVAQETVGPGSHVVTQAQGVLDGMQLRDRLIAAGYPMGSFPFWDLENGAPFSQPEQAYIKAGLERSVGAGFGKGVYASHVLMPQVMLENPGVRPWAFRVNTLSPSTSPLPVDDLPPDLSGCEVAGAVMWQYRQNVTIEVPGGLGPLVVDLDASTIPDPSAPS
jgi:hypothetical protein